MEKKVLVGIIIGLIVLGAGYWFFFYTKTCTDQNCFNNALGKCSRASYIAEKNMTFEYEIIGVRDKRCAVNVELLSVGVNTEAEELVGTEMRCSLLKGVIISPESDINNCHGLLKEGLQDLIISKMHEYIVQNLDRINAEI